MDHLTDYELQRQQNIARNEARAQVITADWKQRTALLLTPKPWKQQRHRKQKGAAPVRASSRLNSKAAGTPITNTVRVQVSHKTQKMGAKSKQASVAVNDVPAQLTESQLQRLQALQERDGFEDMNKDTVRGLFFALSPGFGYISSEMSDMETDWVMERGKLLITPCNLHHLSDSCAVERFQAFMLGQV